MRCFIKKLNLKDWQNLSFGISKNSKNMMERRGKVYESNGIDIIWLKQR